MASNRDSSDEAAERRRRLSRRAFLAGVGSVGAAAVLIPEVVSLTTHKQHADSTDASLAGVDETDGDDSRSEVHAGTVTISLSINGAQRKVTVEPRTTLLSALRDRLQPPLTGTKLVCDRGSCGACTVLLGGKPVYSCMTLAVDVVDKPIITIEGIADDPDHLHPVQAAFIEHDALQCGFCTPGFVMSVTHLLSDNPKPTLDDVRHACAGNVCRCGTYPRVFEAALAAAGIDREA